MELTTLKVKIGLKKNGNHEYPDFNKLQVVIDSGMDWCKYVDIVGLGWQYDKMSGHGEETIDSPRGQQLGILLVPEEFTIQAIAMYPDTCFRMNEKETTSFYDEKIGAKASAEIVDEKVINAINAKNVAGVLLTDDDRKALDPDDSTPGITKNPLKTYVTFKENKKFTIK